MSDKTEELTKDQKLDKVFWFKVLVSIVFGIAFGLLNMKGIISIILFLLASIILTSLYFSKFVSTENEDIDYQSEVLVEGLNVSVPLFLLCWIMTYTMSQFIFKGTNTVAAEL